MLPWCRKEFNELSNNIFRYEYELLVVQGLVLNDSVTPIIRRTAKEPPITLSPDELGGKAAARKIFTMGVRLKSPEVSISILRYKMSSLRSLSSLNSFSFPFFFSSSHRGSIR